MEPTKEVQDELLRSDLKGSHVKHDRKVWVEREGET